MHRLRCLGRLSLEEFADFFRVERLKSLGKLSVALSERLARETEPWLRLDIERELTAIHAATQRPLHMSPADLPDGALDPLGRVQKLLVDFAALVEAWPGLLLAARTLRERGRDFTISLGA